jgi:hypothetical protein
MLPYLFLGPRPVSSGRHLPGAKARDGRVGIHLSERGKNLGLVVKHGENGGCLVVVLLLLLLVKVVVGSRRGDFSAGDG